MLARLEHVDALEEHVSDWTKVHEPHAAVERLQAAGIPAGVVYKSIDLFEDPQLAYRNHFRELDHAELGRVGYNGPAHELSETPAVLRWSAPLLGEHTEFVMVELLGYGPDEVRRLTEEHILE